MQKIFSPAFFALNFFAFSLTNAYYIGNYEKRAFTGKGRSFDPGSGAIGACGNTFSSTDLVVALPDAQFSGSCGRTVSITSGGTTAQGTVVDRCAACASGDVDMTPSLFEIFAPLDTGIIDVTWDFV